MRVSLVRSSPISLVTCWFLSFVSMGCTRSSSPVASLDDAGSDSTGIHSSSDLTSEAPLFGGGDTAPSPSADTSEMNTEVASPAVPIAACDYAVGGTGSALIDDFEDGNVTTLEHDGRAGTWFFYDDATSGTRADSVEIDPQGERSGRVLSFSASGFTDWGSGFGVGFNWNSGQCTYDASVYDGVEFWLKGEGNTRVTLQNLSVRPIALGGQCPTDASCFDSHGVDLTLPATWTHFRLPFADFLQAGWGTGVGPLDPAALYVLEFQLGGIGSHSVWLDDVAFYKSLTEDDAGVAPIEDAGATDAGHASTGHGSSGTPDASAVLQTWNESSERVDGSTEVPPPALDSGLR